MTLGCAFPRSFAKNQGFTSCRKKLLHSAFHSCRAKWLSRVQPFVTPWTVTHQTALSLGILQARVLEWVAISSSRAFSEPRDWTQVFTGSSTAGRLFTTGPPADSIWEKFSMEPGAQGFFWHMASERPGEQWEAFWKGTWVRKHTCWSLPAIPGTGLLKF